MTTTIATIENRDSFDARLRKIFSKDEVMLIQSAYSYAKKAHRNQMRDCGKRYFEHPREGAIIMMDELKWHDANAIAAFLLHDTGEDDDIFGNSRVDYDVFVETALFRLSRAFNKEVAELVIGLTKPPVDGKRFPSKDHMMKFYVGRLKKNRKLFLLKMVDRLHNLRSLDGTSPVKREKTIKETREVYVPMIYGILKRAIPSKRERALFQEIVSIVGCPMLVPQLFKVLCQKWEESERGWGTRPDGYSLHTSRQNAQFFIKKYWDRMPNEVPDEYARPHGAPYLCTVHEETYREVERAERLGKFGIRCSGRCPDDRFASVLLDDGE